MGSGPWSNVAEEKSQWREMEDEEEARKECLPFLFVRKTGFHEWRNSGKEMEREVDK